MFVVEMRENAANTQLHSQASRKANRAWQLPNIMRFERRF